MVGRVCSEKDTTADDLWTTGRTERLKAFQPRPLRGLFRGDYSPALTNQLQGRSSRAPLFARVGGRVLILGPAIRRGAFFVAIVRPAL